MPHVIDPDFGYLEFHFPDGQSVVVDVYEAHERYAALRRVYFHELESAGRQAEVTETEVSRRWASAVFPERGTDRLSHSTRWEMYVAATEVLNSLKKGEPGSSTPAGPGSTGSTASPTA